MWNQDNIFDLSQATLKQTHPPLLEIEPLSLVFQHSTSTLRANCCLERIHFNQHMTDKARQSIVDTINNTIPVNMMYML